MGVFFNEEHTQSDVKAHVKALSRFGAKDLVRSGIVPKKDKNKVRSKMYKVGLERHSNLINDGKALDRFNKTEKLRTDRNRSNFFAHEDYSEDQAHDHKFGFDDSEGLYNADDYGHDEDDFAIDPGHSEKNDVYKDNAAAKLPGVLAASTAGGVTADDAADLQEGYGNDSLRAEFRDRIDSLQKRKDARKENEYSRNKYFVDKMRKQAQRNIRAKLSSNN